MAPKNGAPAAHPVLMLQSAVLSPYSTWKRIAAAAARSCGRVAPVGSATCHKRSKSSSSTKLTGQPAWPAQAAVRSNVSIAWPMAAYTSPVANTSCSARRLSLSPDQRLLRSTATADRDTPIRNACPHFLRMQSHPFDFSNGSGAALDQPQRGQAQAARAVFVGGRLDLADRPFIDDQFADFIIQCQYFGNRAAPLVAGAAAIAAALALHEFVVQHVGPREAHAGQFLVVGPVFSGAMGAIGTYQTLRPDAVQGRHEGIRIDAHMGKAAEHVEHVIRVHGSQDQVAR